MSSPILTINLVVHNGEKYIRKCLEAVLAQSYPSDLIELNILDNNSTDLTIQGIDNWKLEIGKRKLRFNFVQSKLNLGMWPGQEKLLEQSRGKYVIALSVDVILHPDFIKNAVEVMERDEKIGALQAKVYKYELDNLRTHDLTRLRAYVIDTLGFQIFRSRRVVNIGHGDIDNKQYDTIPSPKAQILNSTATTSYKEIFAVEGAVPVFRRVALEDCRLESQNPPNLQGTPLQIARACLDENDQIQKGRIIDPDFFWYGDDLDLAWRMRMFGWKQVYAPNVIAWHDRKTTKALAGGWREFIKIRKTVPIFKRRLDWRNTSLVVIKNDFAINWLHDWPHILWRQLRLWAYFIFFEPTMILEIFNIAKMLPRMLKRRREIMRKARISPRKFRQWIHK